MSFIVENYLGLQFEITPLVFDISIDTDQVVTNQNLNTCNEYVDQLNASPSDLGQEKSNQTMTDKSMLPRKSEKNNESKIDLSYVNRKLDNNNCSNETMVDISTSNGNEFLNQIIELESMKGDDKKYEEQI